MSDLPPSPARQPVPASATLRGQRTVRLRAARRAASARASAQASGSASPPPSSTASSSPSRQASSPSGMDSQVAGNVVGIVVGLLYYGYLEGGATGSDARQAPLRHRGRRPDLVGTGHRRRARHRSLLRAVDLRDPLWARLLLDALGRAEADVARQDREHPRREGLTVSRPRVLDVVVGGARE